MPDLNCTEFEARLEELVEDGRSLGEFSDEGPDSQAALWRDLRAQANACPHCRQLWNEFALLERVLPLCKELTPPVDLADAVIARWREESQMGNPSSAIQSAADNSNGRSRSAGRSVFALLMVIAATLLACIPFLFSPDESDELPPTFPIAKNGAEEPPGHNGELKQTQTNVSPRLETEPDLDWQTMAQDAGSAYWALASDTADSFASVTVFVPARKPAEKPQPVQATKPPAAWTQGIGTGLKPIGRDVGRAMGFLLEALPGENTL